MKRLLAALVLAALWMGAALITIAVVAPGAFAVLPTRALAGEMVGRVLPVVFATAILVHAAVPVVAPAVRRSPSVLSASLLAMITSAAALLVVDPRIAALRAAAVVPIDQLTPTDPRRTMFGLLHVVSVGLLALTMLANAALLLLLARATVRTAHPIDEVR